MGKIFDKIFKRNSNSSRKEDEHPKEGEKKDVPGDEKEKEIKLKIVFIGDSGTGAKTSFISCYVKDEFSEDVPLTVSVALHSKVIVAKRKKCQT